MYVVCLSGPERTRAQAEVAIEAAHIPFLPSDHHGMMGWNSKLASHASGQEPEEPHGFITVVAENVNAPVAAVEDAGWVLRVHYPMPAEPKKDPLTKLLEDMQARISELEAKAGA